MIRTMNKKNVKWKAKKQMGAWVLTVVSGVLYSQRYLNHQPLFARFFFINLPLMPIVHIAGQRRLFTL
ncbi:hypothetical protein RC98_01235 [Pectobacterium carotovorum subsp. carotovorum]|nr:hypothetical protein RC98_01235 [Pectobacterium carotovorum subsp. carotovorum]GKW37159.1 hypothetical protein PEC301875_11830 [Pectobacterium carotovorum subsp. carotovorum]